MPPPAATTVTPAPAGDLSRGLLAASIAVTAWGVSSVIARVIPLGAFAIAAYRFGLYFMAVAAWRAFRRQPLSKAAFIASIPGGLWLAIDVVLFFSAVKLTTVVNATIIGSLQPLVLTIYGVRFLGERLRQSDIGLGLLALAAVIVVVLAGGDSGDASLTGDLLAVGALAAWSTYFVLAKRADGKVTPTDFTLAASLIVALITAPLAPVFGQSMAWPSWDEWGWLAVMAFGAGFLGHNLMNWSLPRVPLWLGSTMTLLVPVVSSAIAWAFLDQPLNAIQIAAMAVALVAIGTLVRSQSAVATTTN